VTVRENIFVPFYTTKRAGTGVGLSLVQQIMRAHHGDVDVASAVGVGTDVRWCFNHASPLTTTNRPL